MPLQNRVDPFGDIHAVEWRGMFTGNRGVIHDPDTKTLLRRRWSTKAWIICACEYKGKRRRSDGPQHAERQCRLDRAVLPRRGDRAGRRPSALLLLPARGGEGIRRAATARRSASPSQRSARSTAGCTRKGWLQADEPATITADEHRRVAGRCDGCGRRQGARLWRAARCGHGTSAAMARPSQSTAPWQAR